MIQTSDNAGDDLLQVRDLQTHFGSDEGPVRAVDGVSWSIKRGQTLALVGESGCGKSVSALSVMRLIPEPPGRYAGGQIVYRGRNLLELTEAEMRAVRGNEIAMIFQEPMTSLNPVYSIGNQIVEAIELHQDMKGQPALDHAVEMLRRVGIAEPQQRVREYPHQMSGGMRQRVMIAMALSCNPDLLIADEPTTALDVTIQAQILLLLKRLQADTGMAILLITHDLGVVAEVADRVAVMYAGKIAELADVDELFSHPLHPYTQGLLKCVPKLSASKDRLEVIPGHVPNPLHFPDGCKFHPRCPLGHDDEQCRRDEPQLEERRPDHWVACWKAK
ncbi:MAG: ABC transporter ATP-binding protein [Phycisphaerae bacterium]|nr:ABC transporter ATP-binding protein [Phycisphaerae bacterium]